MKVARLHHVLFDILVKQALMEALYGPSFQSLPAGGYGSSDTRKGAALNPLTSGGRKRFNVIAMCIAVLLPWFVFVATLALRCSELSYRSPDRCDVLVSALALLLLVVAIIMVALHIKARLAGEVSDEPSWSSFVAVTALISLIVASFIGQGIFLSYTRPFYDVDNLNEYASVDPMTMRGQELMDAGKVTFVAGTSLDLKRAMSFKNVDSYCVAPITGPSRQPLSSYDFFAVGKNCCDGDYGDTSVVNFKCGAYDSTTANGGIRLVKDDERAWYRLAIQQAESAYGIKANHPLFFTWVENSDQGLEQQRQDSYRIFLGMVFIDFFVQSMLVLFTSGIFSRYYKVPRI